MVVVVVVVVVIVVLLMCRSTSANVQETVAVLAAHFPHVYVLTMSSYTPEGFGHFYNYAPVKLLGFVWEKDPRAQNPRCCALFTR